MMFQGPSPSSSAHARCSTVSISFHIIQFILSQPTSQSISHLAGKLSYQQKECGKKKTGRAAKEHQLLQKLESNNEMSISLSIIQLEK